MQNLFLPLILLFASLSPLSAAYIAEYGFGFLPCEWCLYQRIPYGLIAVLATSALLFPRYERWLTGAALLFFLIEIALAFIHSGIEQHWWSFTSNCLEQSMARTVEEELARLKATPVIPCDQPAFSVLGLSMAAWNTLYALSATLYLSKVWYEKNFRK